MFKHPMAIALVAVLVVCTWPPQHVFAQKAARCCLPNEVCHVLTAFACSRAGGVYQKDFDTCDPTSCAGQYHPGVGMSRTAARRILREGVVHTVWWYPAVGHENDLYTLPETDPLWSLTATSGLVFAPQIRIDLRWDRYNRSGFQEHAASVAADLAAQVASAKQAFDEEHATDGAVFNWAVRFEALGTSNDWEIGWGILPCFANNAADVAAGKMSRRRHIAQGGFITWAGIDPVTGEALIDIADANYQYPFYQQFPADYYTAPFNATISIGEEESR